LTTGVRFLAGAGIFLFAISSRPALEPTQPPSQWVPEVLSRRVKRQEREADHSPPSSAENENEWSCAFIPHTSWSGAWLSANYVSVF